MTDLSCILRDDNDEQNLEAAVKMGIADKRMSSLKLDCWRLFFAFDILTVFLNQSWCQSSYDVHFYRDHNATCLVDIGVTYSEDPLIGNERSKIRCAARCLQDGGCSKFLYCRHREKNCFRIKVFGTFNDEETSTKCECYIRVPKIPCQNGGTLSETGSCQCLRGFYGTLCEQVIEDCSDGYNKGGEILSSEEWDTAYIRPAGSPVIFPVNCLNFWGGYTFLQQRVNRGEAVDFNRSWEEYRRGFGEISGHHWLGLDQIHLLTRRSNNLDVSFYDGEDVLYQVLYTAFSVGNISTNYTVHIGSFLSHPDRPFANDSFTPPNSQNMDGFPFSTYDHNPSGSSCPTDLRSGWWFTRTCTAANLNGPLITEDEFNSDNSQPRITWLNQGYIEYIAMRVSDKSFSRNVSPTAAGGQ